MEEKYVDARGLACPQPVVLTRKAILEPGTERVRVVVDNEVSAENVERMGKSLGCEASVEEAEGEIHILLSKGDDVAAAAARQPMTSFESPAPSPQVVVLVTSDLFGTGPEALGRILMRSFIKTLGDLDPRPGKIIFANSGVRLTTEGSSLIEDLRALENEGTEIISCGTCLDYYHLLDGLQVGSVSNMYEIASALVGADRVVRP